MGFLCPMSGNFLYSCNELGGRQMSGDILGNSCPLSLPYVLFVPRLFVVLVVSHLGFEDRILFLVVTVPEHCLLFTFTVSLGALNPCSLSLRILCLSWAIVGWHVLLTLLKMGTFPTGPCSCVVWCSSRAVC